MKEEYIKKINEVLETINETWLLGLLYRIVVNVTR